MPFLNRAWYVIAIAETVTDTPIRRVLLDQAVVLYRASDGKIAALQDRCPHRFVPLSMGRVVDDAIECPYHGLQFDGTGACTLNPNGEGKIPAQARVRSYPCVERHGFVWLWMGKAEEADPSSIPDYSYLDDPDRDVIRGYLHLKANYMLIVDNLLDASHAQTLHPAFARKGGQQTLTNFAQEGDVVYSLREQSNTGVSNFFRMMWDQTAESGDTHSNWRWDAPSTCTHDLGITLTGAPKEDGLMLKNLHTITPETEYSSHYFYAASRNMARQRPDLDAEIAELLHGVFTREDGPVIEAQQVEMGKVIDITTMRPVLLEADVPAVRARRVLTRRIAEEQAIQ